MKLRNPFKKEESIKVTTPVEIHTQRRKLVKELLKAKETNRTIISESKKQARQLDVAIRIAIATGRVK